MASLALEHVTRAEALERVAVFLERRGVDDARRDAKALLLAAGELTRADLLLEPAARLSPQASRRLSDYAQRRAAREPVSRILGGRGFWTQDLVVAPGVLDPRPDTETLIELTLDRLRDRRSESLTILDLSAGSGAIVCALLSELRDARAVAIDLSARACAATTTNVVRCGVAERATVVQGCWARAIDAPFDVVVSNPPYIASEEIAALAPEVRLYDPTLALDGGADGLDCYREIIGDLPRLLAPRGLTVFEVGAGQARDVATLLGAKGLEIAEIRRDVAGHERALAAHMRR